jgi:ribosomal protein L29
MEMDGEGGGASQEELADENKRLKAELAAMRESMSQRL